MPTEEIIKKWDEARHLADDVLSHSPDERVTHVHLGGERVDKTPEDGAVVEMRDATPEYRRYRLVDGDGNEVKMPLSLQSITQIVEFK